MTQVTTLLDKLRTKKLKLATAESCTGGMIASTITDIAGSSDVFECGFVTYSNQSKVDMLKVRMQTIEQRGAVSEPVCKEMAAGALRNCKASISVAVTGIAGPGGGTEEKPVGLVYIAVATKDAVKVARNQFSGNRDEIRKAAVAAALQMVEEVIG